VVVSQPGTLLVIPVADLAQHLLLGLCYFLQNSATIRDDVHAWPIPSIEKFKDIVDIENTWPLSFVEQEGLRGYSLTMRGDDSLLGIWWQ
jgi:hypothetical protein